MDDTFVFKNGHKHDRPFATILKNMREFTNPSSSVIMPNVKPEGKSSKAMNNPFVETGARS